MTSISRSKNSPQLVFITGFSRSGTTLLNVLLGNHSQIFGVGELNHLSPKNLCGCGEPLRNCQFWEMVASELSSVLGVPKDDFWEEDFVPLDRGSLINTILMKASMYLGNAAFSRLVQAVNRLAVQHQQRAANHWLVCDEAAKVASVPYIADSTANTYRLWSLYRLRPKDMKVIHLVRDGRNVVASIKKSGTPVEVIARRWKSANRNISRVLRSIPEASQYRQRYEDLCRNPTSQLSALCEFIGVEPERSMEELGRRTYHEIPGNPMLHRREHGIKIRDNWRNELSRSEADVFERISGQMNRRYGYE